MRKRFLSLAMIFVLPFAVAACGNYNIADENAPPQNVEEDPFAGVQEDGDLGFLSHGEANPARADDQSVLPYEYHGGEFVLDYQFVSEGKLDSIGFLLFLDGKPQAYKVNDTGAEYEYLHCFRTSEKHEEKFSFVFTPDTGEKGDTLNMTVVSVTRPDFQPDMKETSSYGWYHQSFVRVLKLHFNEDAPESDSIYGESITAFRDVSISEEKVTSSFIENELVKAGWDGVTMDTLDNSVYWTMTHDGEVVYTETIAHGNLREYYRVKPLSDECRELTKKYIYGLSFVNYNMLVTNWDADNVEEILMPRMFEDIYRVYTNEPFRAEGGLIPAEIYERVMTTCFPVSVEQVREYCGYHADAGGYEYEMIFVRQFPPFEEVVDYKYNEDGTITLYVDGVWIDYNSDYAFTNQIVVQPFPDGTFRYLSNTIEQKELELPQIGK